MLLSGLLWIRNRRNLLYGRLVLTPQFLWEDHLGQVNESATTSSWSLFNLLIFYISLIQKLRAEKPTDDTTFSDKDTDPRSSVSRLSRSWIANIRHYLALWIKATHLARLEKAELFVSWARITLVAFVNWGTKAAELYAWYCWNQKPGPPINTFLSFLWHRWNSTYHTQVVFFLYVTLVVPAARLWTGLQ